MLLLTPFALRVPSTGDPLHRPDVLSAAWWRSPFEVWGHERLPRVDADLLDVAADAQGKVVVAVGRHGTILRSEDSGATWELQKSVPVRDPEVTEQQKPAKPPSIPAPEKPAAAPATVPKPDQTEQGRRKKDEAARLKAEKEAAHREYLEQQAATRNQDNREGGTGTRNKGDSERNPLRGLDPVRQGPPANEAPNAPADKPAQPNAPKNTSLNLLRWLLPEAHAVEAPTPNRVPPAPPVTARPNAVAGAPNDDTPTVLTDDLVAVAISGATAKILSARGLSLRIENDRTIHWAHSDGRLTMPFGSDVLLVSATGPPSSSGLGMGLFSNGVIQSISSSNAREEFRGELPGARAVRHCVKEGSLAVARSQVQSVAFLLGGSQDQAYRLGQKWTPVGTAAPVDLRGLFCLDPSQAWVLGIDNRVFRTDDEAKTWRASDYAAPVPLNAAYFLGDKKTGWLVGDDGYIATTTDGGATFVSRTCPRRLPPAVAAMTFPPPWYGVGWLLTIGLFFLGRSIPASKDARTEVAVTPAFATDRPLEQGDPDVLNLTGLAAGLSRFLRNEATQPPLTVAITGPWGTGKSSLMNLLRADLRSFGFSPVWFNAWHHQKEEHLLAALLQAIRNQAIPAVWRLEGLLFRIHLLLIRGRKHAVKLLVLLFVTGVLLSARTQPGVTWFTPSELWKTVHDWVSYLVSPNVASPKGGVLDSIHLVGLGTLSTLIIGLIRGLRAFGLNPGALLATAGGSLKMRDLEAQSSFREKFRSEYHEVTRALGVRTLLLFVDDLDRCQPDQVLDVLESINYLVTSGDCFVIMGVDRTRVEPCVALAFRAISAELSGKDDPEHRKDYARQYLDKLINIEVAIPRFGAGEARALLVPRSLQTVAAPPKAAVEGDGDEAARRNDANVAGAGGDRLRSLGRDVVEILKPGFVRLWPVLVAVLALVAGYQAETRLRAWGLPIFSGSVPEETSAKDEVGTAKPGAPRAQTPTGAGGAAAGTSAPAASASAPNAAAAQPSVEPNISGAKTPEAQVKSVLSPEALAIAEEIRKRPPEQRGGMQPPPNRSVPIKGLFWLLVGVWFVFLLIQAARLRPELVVRDSDEFVGAWQRWYPIIFQKSITPRALKRFQNRVRFLSMRQRASTEDRGWARRLLDPFLGRAAPPPARAVPRADAGAADHVDADKEIVIPDPLLVVLAAIRQSCGHLFEEITDAATLARDPKLVGIAKLVELPAKAGSKEHPATIEELAQNIVDYRAVFRARDGGIEVN